MDQRVLKTLRSAEKRISFSVEQFDGVVSAELLEALKEIREAIKLVSMDSETQPGKRTVLFVDDEEIIRRIASQMLANQGYRVLTAGDGVEGLEVFEQNRESVDCVILDLVMPRMDGLQVYRQLQKTAPEVGVILTTGYGEEEIRKRFGSLGQQGFMRKPFSASTLFEMVEGALRGDLIPVSQ